MVLGIAKNKKTLFYDDEFLTIDIENIISDERIERADGSTGILAVQFKTNIKNS